MRLLAAALALALAGPAYAQAGPKDEFGQTEGPTSLGTQVEPAGQVGTPDDALGSEDAAMGQVSPTVPDLEKPVFPPERRQRPAPGRPRRPATSPRSSP